MQSLSPLLLLLVLAASATSDHDCSHEEYGANCVDTVNMRQFCEVQEVPRSVCIDMADLSFRVGAGDYCGRCITNEEQQVMGGYEGFTDVYEIQIPTAAPTSSSAPSVAPSLTPSIQPSGSSLPSYFPSGNPSGSSLPSSEPSSAPTHHDHDHTHGVLH